MTELPPVLSYGAGVNSTALAILAVNQGWKGEIVFSDTGAEWPETYCYMDYFEREYLAPRGMHVTRLGPRHSGNKPSMAHGSLIEYCEERRIVPMAAARWCTINWKSGPLDRYADGRETMIGICADEAHRQRGRCCPLVDLNIDRRGCIEIIQRAGLDVPQKSGCYICPFQRPSQWRELWQRHPELYERAERLEANVKRGRSGRTMITLDVSGKVTLAQRRYGFENQTTLPEIDMDELREFQPCVCTL